MLLAYTMLSSNRNTERWQVEEVIHEVKIIETDDGYRIEIKGDKERLKRWFDRMPFGMGMPFDFGFRARHEHGRGHRHGPWEWKGGHRPRKFIFRAHAPGPWNWNWTTDPDEGDEPPHYDV